MDRSHRRYTWTHNQVLSFLANKLECKRISINAQPFSNHDVCRHPPPFVWEGVNLRSSPSTADLAVPNERSQGLTDASRLRPEAHFPPSDSNNHLVTRPHLPYSSPTSVSWEDVIEEAFERKKLWHAILAAEAEDGGWKIKVCQVVVGCRGFVASTTAKVGVRGQAIKELADTAERTSHWLWLKRRTNTHRLYQPVVGLLQRRVYCDKWPKHPVKLRYTTDDVSWQ